MMADQLIAGLRGRCWSGLVAPQARHELYRMLESRLQVRLTAARRARKSRLLKVSADPASLGARLLESLAACEAQSTQRDESDAIRQEIHKKVEPLLNCLIEVYQGSSQPPQEPGRDVDPSPAVTPEIWRDVVHEIDIVLLSLLGMDDSNKIRKPPELVDNISRAALQAGCANREEALRFMRALMAQLKWRIQHARQQLSAIYSDNDEEVILESIQREDVIRVVNRLLKEVESTSQLQQEIPAALTILGLEALQPDLAAAFDPTTMEIVGTQSDDEQVSRVIQVVDSGLRFKRQVLRRAKVVIGA